MERKRGVRRLVGPALPWLDRRFDWRADRRIEAKFDLYEQRVLCRYARQEALNAVEEKAADVYSGLSEMLVTMRELRRWSIDNLDASGETAVLLGETLTRLQGSVDRLADEVSAMAERLGRIEAAMKNSDSAPPG
ncbi:MAG: hypothetical protein ACRDY7_16510 [Acidimicrobiia bacterium]